MTTTALSTDYLIVGSGAVGMAFADTLVAESDADVVVVDRYAKPGGHWNFAYPFVTLHQPSQFYGVASRELSNGHVDQVGLNRGLHDLASGAEVSAYFDDIMRHTLLPTGRVRYFPLCSYTGDGDFQHTLSGERFHVEATTVVDCTLLNTEVPATHTPNFEIADGVRFLPLNELPRLREAPAGYVVVGGGKTGIDAVLWLLEHRVDPAAITWIVPRDAWMLNRGNIQPGMEFFETTIGTQADQYQSIAEATSIADMFDRLEACGYFLRLDPDVRPSMFHAATVSELELEQLRRIDHVVRLGRVQRIELDQIVMDDGIVATTSDHLFVDCSARAIPALEPRTIFEPDVIRPQTVRGYQPAFSASFVAHIEVTRDSLDEKNRLCQVVPLPNHDVDYIRLTLAAMTNQYHWGLEPDLSDWIASNRLDGFSATMRDAPRDDEAKQEILARLRTNVFPAAQKLAEFAAEL
ncbi:MAG: NAD(P)-binding protein [Actinomycetota bacterium]